MGNNLLLTPDEAAERLRISKAHLYDLKARQKIRFVKIGRCLRFRPQDLEAFVDDAAEVTAKEMAAFPNP